MRNILLLFCCLALCATAVGCGSKKGPAYFSRDRAAVVPDSPNAVWHVQQGRSYVAQGRYELAREHYLMAVAAAGDGAVAAIAAEELRGADLMIKTQR